jgi:hypothetical protein
MISYAKEILRIERARFPYCATGVPAQFEASHAFIGQPAQQLILNIESNQALA